MIPRRLPVGRIAAALALIAAIVLITRGATGVRWRTLRPGAEFTTLRGDAWCKRGPATVAALRLDPARVVLRVRHYSLLPGTRPPTIVEWQRVTGALAVFNAGQYYEDYSYMGLLVCDGRVVSRRLHPDFKAALVSAPVSGPPAARIIDLEREPLDPDSLAWREVAQSFMLFDRAGGLRIRRSDRIANRTAVGQDRHGRLLVVTSEGAYTLADFAQLLRSPALDLEEAMSMDGGYEAELCIAADAFRYASFGPWPRGTEGEEAPGARTPLPAVVTVLAP